MANPAPYPSRTLASPDTAPDQGINTKSSVKEIITSLTIAFALAFVFRGFVVEAFLIPTGSMAPTLLGAHVKLLNQRNGYAWTVGPKDIITGSGGLAAPVQTGVHDVFDTNTREEQVRGTVPTSSGDRIFVVKYLGGIYEPKRFDCVVFKNPTDPTINYIKRLVGLPGEQIAIVDGDVFVRTPTPQDDKGANPWSLPGWKAQSKPEREQQAMWQLVFDSSYAPLDPDSAAMGRYTSRWIGKNADGSAKGWTIPKGPGAYSCDSVAPTALAWDADKYPVTDATAYNELGDSVARGVERRLYPVSDVRLSMGIKPKASGLALSGVIVTRGHVFRAEVSGKVVTMKMRPLGADGAEPTGPWTELASGTMKSPLPEGKVTNVECWLADQTLQFWREGELVVGAEVPWTIEDRLKYTFGVTPDEVRSPRGFEATLMVPTKSNPRKGKGPALRWEFVGAPFELHRVRLDRDIHYQTNFKNYDNSFARATHPDTTMRLNTTQYFVCGDNSPGSLDARLWGPNHPWVSEIDTAQGIVPRDLMIGKAFLVYFPAPVRKHGIPIPNVGEVRWIW